MGSVYAHQDTMIMELIYSVCHAIIYAKHAQQLIDAKLVMHWIIEYLIQTMVYVNVCVDITMLVMV
jgi:hypothetical protein